MWQNQRSPGYPSGCMQSWPPGGQERGGLPSGEGVRLRPGFHLGCLSERTVFKNSEQMGGGTLLGERQRPQLWVFLRLCQWDSHTEMSSTQSIKAFFFFNVSNLYFVLKKKSKDTNVSIQLKVNLLLTSDPYFLFPKKL